MKILSSLTLVLICFPVLAVQNHYSIWSPNNTVNSITVIGDKTILGGDFNTLSPNSRYFAEILNVGSGQTIDSAINGIIYSPYAYPDGQNGWFTYEVVTDNKYYPQAYIMANGNLNQEFNKLNTEYELNLMRMSSDNNFFYMGVYEKSTPKDFTKTHLIDYAKFNTITNEVVFLNLNFSELGIDNFIAHEIFDSEDGEIVYLIARSDNGTRIIAVELGIEKHSVLWDKEYKIRIGTQSNLNYNQLTYINHERNKITIVGLRPEENSKDEVIGNLDLDSGDFTEYILNIPGTMWFGLAIPAIDHAMYYAYDSVNSKPIFYLVDIVNQTVESWSLNFKLTAIRSFTADKEGRSLYIAGVIEKETILNEGSDKTYIKKIPYVIKSNLLTGEIEKEITNDKFSGMFYPTSITLNGTDTELFLGTSGDLIGGLDNQNLTVLDSNTLRPISNELLFPGPVNEVERTSDESILLAHGFSVPDDNANYYPFTALISVKEDISLVCINDCELTSIEQQVKTIDDLHKYVDNENYPNFYSLSLAKFVLTDENKVIVVNDDIDNTVDFELTIDGRPEANSHLSGDGKIFHLVTQTNRLRGYYHFNFYDIDLSSKSIVNATLDIISPYLGIYRVAGSNRIFSSRHIGGWSSQRKLSRLPLSFPQSIALIANDEEVVSSIENPEENKTTIFISDSTYLTLECIKNSYLTCEKIFYIDKGSAPLLYNRSFSELVDASLKPQEYNDSLYVEKSKKIIYWSTSDSHKEPYKEIEVVVDKKEPESKISHSSGSYEDELEFYFECNDQGESGCATIYFTLDGTEPEYGGGIYDTNEQWSLKGTNSYDPNYLKYKDGKLIKATVYIDSDKMVNYYSVDYAGRREKMKSVYFSIEDKWWKGSLDSYIYLIFSILVLQRFAKIIKVY